MAVLFDCTNGEVPLSPAQSQQRKSRDDGTGLVRDVRKGRAGSRTPARNTSPAVAQIGLDIASPCAAAAARPQATAGRAASRRSRRVDDGRPRIYWGAISFSRWSLDTRVAPGFPALRSRPAGERRCHRRPLPLTFAGASSPLAGVPMSSKSVGRLSATLFGNRHVDGGQVRYILYFSQSAREVLTALRAAGRRIDIPALCRCRPEHGSGDRTGLTQRLPRRPYGIRIADCLQAAPIRDCRRAFR